MPAASHVPHAPGLTGGVRQFHRWISLVFTLTVVANFVARGLTGAEPSPWVTYSPLPPLALLLITGLYLFVRPYVAQWRAR